MATRQQYGGGYGGYQRGYGGYQGGYSVDPLQYQSFFNPIPLDFLQDQFDRRQARYDTSVGAALTAKQAALEAPVALSDIDRKNELVQQSVNDIQSIVDEKYGGDWGAASKEVARQISSIREDPFWKLSEYVAKQQDLQQKYMLQNPTAHIYQDVMNIGAHDPDSQQLRDVRDLTFEGGPRGNWSAAAQALIGRVNASVTVEDLERAGIEDEDIKTFVANRKIEYLSNESIQKIIGYLDENDNMLAQAFIDIVPDFEESKRRIDGKGSQQIYNDAKEFIYAHARQLPYTAESVQYISGEPPRNTGDDGTPTPGGLSTSIGGESYTVEDQTDIGTSKSYKEVKSLREEVNSLRESHDPDSPRRVQKEEEYQDVINERNLVLERMGMSEYNPENIIAAAYEEYIPTFRSMGPKTIRNDEGVDITVTGTPIRPLFEQTYGHEFNPDSEEDIALINTLLPEDRPMMTRQEFNDAINQMVAEGVTEDEIPGTKGARGDILNKTARQVRRNMNDYAKKYGKIAENLQILGANDGTSKDTRTAVGQINSLLTNLLQRTSGNWQVAGTEQQLNDYIREINKVNATDVDMDNSWASMTIGTDVSGKAALHFLARDKENKPLGSVYIVPGGTGGAGVDDAGIRSTVYEGTNYMLASGSPIQQSQALAIRGNYEFGPIVRNAGIYKSKTGELEGATFDGQPLHFDTFTDKGGTLRWRLWQEDEETGDKVYVRYGEMDEETGEVVEGDIIDIHSPSEMQATLANLQYAEIREKARLKKQQEEDQK